MERKSNELKKNLSFCVTVSEDEKIRADFRRTICPYLSEYLRKIVLGKPQSAKCGKAQCA